jgi:predicted dehydrogenase
LRDAEPELVEKPIAEDVASATKLVGAAEAAGVPLLVGHHRRHNLIRRDPSS